MTLLEISTLKKHYGPVNAVDGVSLAIESGSRTAIVGPSGCGKTTLLRLIAGFEAPDGGTIRFDGGLIADARAQIPAHKRGVGIVSQDGALFPHLSVEQNIGFGLKDDGEDRTARIETLMDMVELDRAMLTRRPDQLSGGQQQRVALARALARRPRVILLDEPFSALDTGLRVATRKAVGSVLSAAGITTVLVTHDQAEALAFADQVVVMRAGRFAQVGTPREVYMRPNDAETAAFLGDAIVLDATLKDGRATTILGDIPVNANERSGSARILLRPEQFSILPAEGTGESAVTGTVVDLDFCGPSSELAIVPDAAPDFTVRLAMASRHLLEKGNRVSIEINGPAHVFP
ncbi:iron(III) transport system ATP-binding protein [Neorhizobium galegae]|uniref:ABC transporter ATP-binding protein n=1 Tax=Neorhizobium galegae TaxID=399 RepID=UPI001AEA61F3|nr:ABC transporter ATP-binding protein [Neorhizobium galegae]MBP2550740.1 iron(III) transport system ATP-binding protein [Neorhizobium galegae]